MPTEFGKGSVGTTGGVGSPQGPSLRWSLYCCCPINNWEKRSQIKREKPRKQVDVERLFCLIWRMSNRGVIEDYVNMHVFGKLGKFQWCNPIASVVIGEKTFSKIPNCFSL